LSFGLIVAVSFQLAANSGPVDAALSATETPDTFRAAFTIRLQSANAMREFHFDPRLEPEDRWTLTSWRGEDDDLDEAASAWGSEAAPDGRLFPDDLRLSIGQQVEVDDFGTAWRVAFRHRPSFNDSELDMWIADRVDARAWLDPETGRFLRLDYKLPRPVRGPEGGRLTKFAQTYLLETDPAWGLSFISSYTISFEAKGGFRTIRRDYSATVTEVEFFFSSPDAQQVFEAKQHRITGPSFAGR